MNIKEVILNAKRFEASDIHIICNDYITLRIDGELTRYSSKVVNSDICRKFCDDLIGSEETKFRKRYEKYIDEECGEVDFSRDFDFVDLENEIENNDTKNNKIMENDINRYIKENVKEFSFYNVELNKDELNKEDKISFRIRVNIYRRNEGDCISIRLIPEHVKTAKELNIPDIVCSSGDLKSGIILITGATGSGKSTTLAAIIDRINKTSKKHIITLEEPIEYLHKSDKSIISQRECGKDTVDFLDGLKSSLRQDPDVIMIGEIRDKKTVETALSASETGHLVLSTVHTSKASEAIDRIVNLFEAERHKEIRGLLANQLRYVFSQRLIKANNGRRAIFEIMKNTNSIAAMIREGKDESIDDMIKTGKKYGMQMFEDQIEKLYREEIISEEIYLDEINNR
ncbi:PilT/PilU family type 4a pilus ATPase [Peptacetobacter hiranonis]|uniref:type IV pilus twitching motility protein PilT n=1 Tax=Peptacetobacter hiranonis TaxID=89152 RepID=UPI001917A182|nr:PilT/PilU family type 4a pilus ATPase [Peptacetobacter hiranonis]QQQ86750.1 PilT/PilU family type 4a pilus ATPase [Peptacetobacter hiranonis]